MPGAAVLAELPVEGKAKAWPAGWALAVAFLAAVFALLYGSVSLNEAITPWMIGCGLVIVCGTMLSTGLISTSRKPLEAAKRT